MVAIQLTTSKVPISGELKEASGLPLVAVVQPITTADYPQEYLPHISDIARCQDCLSYINRLCDFGTFGWSCSLCGSQNEYTHYSNHRYIDAAAREGLPELVHPVFEALNPLHSTPVDEQSGLAGYAPFEVYETDANLICIALVDTCSSVEFLDQVRSAVLAGLESLPAGALFGLISFSDEVVLHEICSSHSFALRHIPISKQGDVPTTVDLSDALPLQNLLVPVTTAGKAGIAAALEALQPCLAVQMNRTKRRALGEALQATLRYISSADASLLSSYNSYIQSQQQSDGAMNGSSQTPATATAAGTIRDQGSGTDETSTSIQQQHQPGARLLVFLSGPPNYGRGSVLERSSTGGDGTAFDPDEDEEDEEERAARGHPLQYVIDPYFPEVTAWTVAMPPSKPAPQDNPGTATNGGSGSSMAKKRTNKSYVDLTHAAEELSIEPQTVQRNKAAAMFYKEAAAAAAALGVCVDVYAVSGHYVGLHMLRPISVLSGGGLYLYPSLDECTIPQDVYKRLGEPLTMQCMLRLRTSPELSVAGSLGERLQTDATYDNLFHLACCHPHDAFALELVHSKKSGFATRSTPVLQLVFQYLVIAPSSSPSLGQFSSNQNPKLTLQRRTRVATAAFPLADSATELYSSADPGAITFALVQQVTGAVGVRGRKRAQKAIEEWLVNLAASYHEWVTVGEYQHHIDNAAAHSINIDNGDNSTGREGVKDGQGRVIDTAFSEIDAMQQLPRAVYAICKGPLLGSGLRGTAHPDAASALRTLCATLPPIELSAAVYPQLSSWSSPEDLAFPRHSLSKTALSVSHQPIYLLDTYGSLIIYYTAGAVAAQLPFPPPAESALRRHVAALRQARKLTPRVLVIKEGYGLGAGSGSGDSSVFMDWMIEDVGPRGRGNSSEGGFEGLTFLQFLTQIGEAAKTVHQ